jgi:hypothetical protein
MANSMNAKAEAQTLSMQASLTIGIAAGLVMVRSDVSPAEAEDLLSAAAERVGRSLADVARSYIDTGQV